MNKLTYVFAMANYTDMSDVDYTVIYIAPEAYWNEVGSLENYSESNPGELNRFLTLSCGDEFKSWDTIHWYETNDDAELEDVEDLLISIGLKKSETLKEYADKEVQEFGEQYISELY
jgi:hypothetical protein